MCGIDPSRIAMVAKWINTLDHHMQVFYTTMCYLSTFCNIGAWLSRWPVEDVVGATTGILRGIQGISDGISQQGQFVLRGSDRNFFTQKQGDGRPCA